MKNPLLICSVLIGSSVYAVNPNLTPDERTSSTCIAIDLNTAMFLEYASDAYYSSTNDKWVKKQLKEYGDNYKFAVKTINSNNGTNLDLYKCNKLGLIRRPQSIAYLRSTKKSGNPI